MARILLVDDDPAILKNVSNLLETEQHVVDSADTARSATSLMRTHNHDLMIVDWELPDGSGVDILRHYRDNGGTAPILMLTGKTAVEAKEEGLLAGADDYLVKPFHPRELSARVVALLRRPAVIASTTLRVGDIALDPKKHLVYLGENPVDLLPKEYQLLLFFLKNPDRVFAADDLLERVWPADAQVTAGALRSTMKRLRQRIDPGGNYIQTVHGVGYVLRPK